jgi:hypothetical protein
MSDSELIYFVIRGDTEEAEQSILEYLESSNDFRLHPCCYCSQLHIESDYDKRKGSFSEFRCKKYGGRIIELGILPEDKWARRDSNSRPPRYQRGALPG